MCVIWFFFTFCFFCFFLFKNECFNAEFIVDTWQPVDKYGRSVGLVYCNDMLLNELLLTSGNAKISEYFCDKSEFGSEYWAMKYGC